MTEPSTPSPPGWFPDPLGRHEHRYFNGTSWTSDVADGGQRFVDPFGTGPGWQGAPATSARNGIATAALACGIVGLLLAWVPFLVVVGFTLAVLALIFGFRGLRRSAASGVGRGSSIAGIVTGGIGLALSVLGIVLTVVLFRAIDDFVNPGPVTARATSCAVEGRNAVIEGELTNRSRTVRDYTVFVTVDGETEVFTVDGVTPGDTVTWSTTTRAPSQGECEAEIDVQGPFPFGIEIDPVDG